MRFEETAQPTTVNGLELYLDEVGWQVDTSAPSRIHGSRERARHRRRLAGRRLRRPRACRRLRSPCRPGEHLRVLRRRPARHRLPGRALPRRRDTACFRRRGAQRDHGDGVGMRAYPSHRGTRPSASIGAVAPVWAIEARKVIRFAASADEGAAVVACFLPGRLGGVAAAAAMVQRTATSPGVPAARRFPRTRSGSPSAAARPSGR